MKRVQTVVPKAITRYYLGIPVTIEVGEQVQVRYEADLEVIDGWVWATWPDGRRFKFWADQLRPEPWG
jgi:hypothetical protein